MKDIKIFGSIVEDAAKKQIDRVASMAAFANAKIRIMPDVHAGKGCVCGFTANLGDKVVPNLIGVDLGCGVLAVNLGKTDIDLHRFDEIVHEKIPVGMSVNENILPDVNGFYEECDPSKCHIAFSKNLLSYFKQSMGSLGSGNHFISIERSDDRTNYLLIHTGSRNLGKRVCDTWQEVAVKCLVEDSIHPLNKVIESVKNECIANGKQNEIQTRLIAAKKEWQKRCDEVKVNEDLAYLEGEYRRQYLEDMRLCQLWASYNRKTIARRICEGYGIEIVDMFDTIHNYLGDDNIIRKSAISAKLGERVIIPMNMRDGSLICIGKGNEDWNNSAPHGAGRIMSRAKAKQALNLADFKRSMEGIYTTSCVAETIDEAPDAYKPMDVIMSEIKDTVDVVDVIRPIYNFKGFDKK